MLDAAGVAIDGCAGSGCTNCGAGAVAIAGGARAGEAAISALWRLSRSTFSSANRIDSSMLSLSGRLRFDI